MGSYCSWNSWKSPEIITFSSSALENPFLPLIPGKLLQFCKQGVYEVKQADTRGRDFFSWKEVQPNGWKR